MKPKNKIKSPKRYKYFVHETKKSVLMRFLVVSVIFVLYFTFVSFRYGISNGFLVSVLTWSFFVFCTPVADAGFLIDFPVRLLTKIRMIYSEICVWTIAFILNLYTITMIPGIYEKTALLQLFRHILMNPFPFWLVIFLSAVGTFISIYFGDELIDVAKHKQREKYEKHKNKYKLLLILFIVVIIIALYTIVLRKVGLELILLFYST